MNMIPLTLNLNKLDTHYFTKNEFEKKYKDIKGYFEQEKFDTYLRDLLLEDLEKIQNLLISSSDVTSVIKYVQYISKIATDIENTCYDTAKLISKRVDYDMASISENVALGIKGFETDYSRCDAYIGRSMYFTVSRNASIFNSKIQKILANYHQITEVPKEPNVGILNEDSEQLKKPETTKEQKLTITDADAIIAIFSALREENVIITNDVNVKPTNKELAEILFSNFKIQKKKGNGFHEFETLERYFGQKNDEASKNSNYEKIKKKILIALQSMK